MAELVYLLCLVTCAVCAVLLVRSYFMHRSRILLWSSLCFTGLIINNALLFVDLVMTTADTDLSLVRASVTLVSMSILVFGLVWDVR